jgi:hypothetical protein
VIVDKPAGITSHDAVSRCRRIFATRKVGHAGTLDPMATGVLVIGVVRATKIWVCWPEPPSPMPQPSGSGRPRPLTTRTARLC